MTTQIVAPDMPGVEPAELLDRRLLRLLPKLPSRGPMGTAEPTPVPSRLPVMGPLPIPPAPSPAVPTGEGVPAGVDPGTRSVERTLDGLTPAIAELRRAIASTPAGGFLTSAADVQRLAEVDRLLAGAAAVLAERNDNP
jgi:hypothetical protein